MVKQRGRPIRQVDIRDFELFERADPDSFGCLFRLLQGLGFKVDGGWSQIYHYFRTFEKLAWSPDGREFGQPGELSGFEIVHQGFHSLLASTYSGRLRGRPLVTMLSESIAAPAEVYFVWRLWLAGATLQNPNVRWYFDLWGSSAISNEKTIVRLFNRGLQNPFQEYRNIVLEVFSFCQFLLKYQASRDGPRSVSEDAVLKRATKLRYRHFIHRNDFGNFILYIAANCGMGSDRDDRAITRAILTKLRRAESMAEFVGLLGQR